MARAPLLKYIVVKLALVLGAIFTASDSLELDNLIVITSFLLVVASSFLFVNKRYFNSIKKQKDLYAPIKLLVVVLYILLSAMFYWLSGVRLDISPITLILFLTMVGDIEDGITGYVSAYTPYLLLGSCLYGVNLSAHETNDVAMLVIYALTIALLVILLSYGVLEGIPEADKLALIGCFIISIQGYFLGIGLDVLITIFELTVIVIAALAATSFFYKKQNFRSIIQERFRFYSIASPYIVTIILKINGAH